MVCFTVLSVILAFATVCSTSTEPWKNGNWDWIPEHQELASEHDHDQYLLDGLKDQHGDGYTKTLSRGHRADWGSYNYGGRGDYLKASSYGNSEGQAHKVDQARPFEGTRDKIWDNSLYAQNHRSDNHDDFHNHRDSDDSDNSHDLGFYELQNRRYYPYSQHSRRPY